MTALKIGIVGAGIMGRTLAWTLLQSGHEISLFDKDKRSALGQNDASKKNIPNAAAYAAVGMLAPYSELESTEALIFQLGIRALALWPKLVSTLEADVDFRQQGTLAIAHAADHADLKRLQLPLSHKLTNPILNTTKRWYSINQDEVNLLEPSLSQTFCDGLYFPNEAWLSPPKLLHALEKKLDQHGIHWYDDCTINSITSTTLSFNNAQTHNFDWLIDCRGLGAKQDIKKLRGVRGETITLYAPEVDIKHMLRLMHPRYRLYIVPRKNNIFVIGATQIESEDDSPITVRSSLELLSAVYSIHPGFAEAQIIDARVKCRPALSNNLPRIEQQGTLLRINGLFRHGFLIAPALAEEVSHLINLGEKSGRQYEGLFF